MAQSADADSNAAKILLVFMFYSSDKIIFRNLFLQSAVRLPPRSGGNIFSRFSQPSKSLILATA